MQQAEFEQAVLRVAQHGGTTRFTPQAVAFQLGLDVKDTERMLDRMVTSAKLELDSDDDGNLFYFVPGHGAPGVFTSGVVLDPPAASPAAAPAAVPYGQADAAPPAAWGFLPTGAAAAPSAPAFPPPHANYPAPSAGYGTQPAPPSSNPPYGPYVGAPGGVPSGYGTPHPANVPPHQGYGAPPQSAQVPYGAQGAYGQHPGAYGQTPPGYAPGPVGPPPPYGAPYPPASARPYGYGQHALVHTRGPDGPRSPTTAALLGLIPGAGQLYNGQVSKGLTLFFLTGFLSAFPPLAFIPWVWGIVDAHGTARRQNQQHYGLLGP